MDSPMAKARLKASQGPPRPPLGPTNPTQGLTSKPLPSASLLHITYTPCTDTCNQESYSYFKQELGPYRMGSKLMLR